MRSLLTIILITIILGLMLPIAGFYNTSQTAFTPDNLIRLNQIRK